MMHTIKQVLFQKPDEKEKETKELKKIETEQRNMIQNNSIEAIKKQGIKTFGPEGFYKMYDLLKKQNEKGTNNLKEITKLADTQEKLSLAFKIEQVVYFDINHNI